VVALSPLSKLWGNPMRLLVRVLTVLVALGLVMTAPLAQAAGPSADGGPGSHAKGPKPGKGGDDAARTQRQLLREVAKVSRKIDGATKASRIGMLSDATQAALLDNVAADKTELDGFRTLAATTATSADLRQARKDVKKLRAVNYVLVVNVLRKAERLHAGATSGSAAAVSTAAVVTKALTVDASTDKAMLRELRRDLEAAQALVEANAPAPAPAG
jgi:hypothetical protein